MNEREQQGGDRNRQQDQEPGRTPQNPGSEPGRAPGSQNPIGDRDPNSQPGGLPGERRTPPMRALGGTQGDEPDQPRIDEEPTPDQSGAL